MEKILNNQSVECNENLQGGKIKFQTTFILGNKQKLVDVLLTNKNQVYQLYFN
jgi:hypothetical protein